MISITGEMRDLINSALADGYPCILGTASLSSRPQISPKGSVIVYDEETLAYWERSRRTAMENIGANPQVVIFYRNSELGINWRFHGMATLRLVGDLRDEVMKRIPQSELNYDSERRGAAVLVRVDQITQVTMTAARTLQRREEGELGPTGTAGRASCRPGK